MDWTSIQSEIVSAVSLASEESVEVTWDQLPQGFRPDRHVKLSVSGFSSLGRDELRRVDKGETLEQRVYGVRTLNVLVTVESQRQTLAFSSLALADKIRTALHREDVRDDLALNAGIGIATIGPLRRLDYVDQSSRERSFCSFEVTFNAQTSSAVREIDFIAEVRGSGLINSGSESISVPFSASVDLFANLLTEDGNPLLTESDLELTT